MESSQCNNRRIYLYRFLGEKMIKIRICETFYLDNEKVEKFCAANQIDVPYARNHLKKELIKSCQKTIGDIING